MIRSFYLAAMIFLVPGFASAQCIEKDFMDTLPIPLLRELKIALTRSPRVAECDSLRQVLGKLAYNKRSAGRQLEGDKPFDEAAAQKDLEAARRDPPIRSRVEKIRRDVADENAQLALEAAVLDEEGHYGGRDLVIRQLKQRLN